MEEEEGILINLEIQIDDTHSTVIKIRDDDDIEETVNKFCMEHKYDDNVKQLIMSQIVEALDNNIEELEASNQVAQEQSENLNLNLNLNDSEEKKNITRKNDKHNYTAINQTDPEISKPPSSFENFIENSSSVKEISAVQRNKDTHTLKEQDQEIFTKDSNRNTNRKNNQQNKSLNSEAKRRISHTPDFIPGERLYKQYMEKLPKKREQNERILAERNKTMMKGATFKPSVDKLSCTIISQSPERVQKVEDRLINYGIHQKEKMLKGMSKKTLDQMDYSYHPKLDEKTQIFASIKRKERYENIPENIPGIKSEYLIHRNKSTDVSFHGNSSADICEKKVTTRNKSNENKEMTNPIKKSFVSSSEYTFTNMKVPDQKSTRDQDREKIYERYHTYESMKDISINTERSRSGSQRGEHKNQTKKSEKKNIPTPKLNPEVNIHDFLYVEAKLKKEKKEKLEKEVMNKICPFAPKIPESVKKLVNKCETKVQFINRLGKTKKEAEEIQVVQKMIDPKTGKPLFKPTISRGPKNQMSRAATGDLDGYHDQKFLKDKKKIHETEMYNNLEKKKQWLEKSMKIVLKMKIEKFKEIFELLDSDGDGYISSRNIKLSNLDPEILASLTPLLEELQRKGVMMNFKEFCVSADKFLSLKIFSNNK